MTSYDCVREVSERSANVMQGSHTSPGGEIPAEQTYWQQDNFPMSFSNNPKVLQKWNRLKAIRSEITELQQQIEAGYDGIYQLGAQQAHPC